MQSLSLKQVPKAFKEMLDLIQDETIQNMYSKFTFVYLESIVSNNIEIESACNNKFDRISENQILNYLSYHKFITYFILFSNDIKNINKKQKETVGGIMFPNIESSNIVIFCVEKECLIINSIETSKAKELMKELKNNQISILNMNEDYQIKKSREEEEANEEINNFCSFLAVSKEIKSNFYVKLTIRPIAGYMIRRYYYPTEYFNDQTFFFFDKADVSSKEQSLKKELAKSIICDKLSDFDCKVNSNINKRAQHYIFNKDDFIILRVLYSSNQAIYYFVVHRKTLFVFVMKIFNIPNDSIKDNSNEIRFCENYSHRCFVPFYGFIKEKETTIGIVYEFMCNGTLKSYVKTKQNEITYLFSLNTIIRIFEGIDYLHSNSLIHRDIKPSNILLDHDNIPYISDFPTIRPINKEKEKQSEYTADLGSQPYMSPEQYKGNHDLISYPTDIYSFGMTIYYICEKKEMNMNFNYKKQENNTPIMDKSTSNLQSIFEKCVKYDSSNRITTKKILKMIIKEAISLIYKVDSNIFNDTNETLLFILEMVIILKNNWKEAQKNQKYIQRLLSLILTKIKKQLEKVFNKIYCAFFLFNYIYHTKDFNLLHDIKNAIHQITLFADQNNPEAQLLLGIIYYEGKYVSRDINKSIHYLTLSANQGNPYAQQKLGDIYYEGKCIGRDINKSIHYLTLSANQNNSNALFILGNIYYEGQYIGRDIIKSIHYLTLSANQNNLCAQYILGKIYYEGKYVSRDINKSIYYLTLSANQGNSYAQLMLGEIYYKRDYIELDINKSIHYLTLSANQNNSDAQFILGEIYYEGKYISHDTNKSIYYLTLSANQNNSDAQFILGEIYYEGKYISHDINKSIYYLTLSANQNNSCAQFILGIIYHENKYLSRDIIKSIHYLTQSAKQNHSKAQFFLSNIYMEDKSVQNINESIKLLQYSAYNNYREAQLILADLLFEGIHLKYEIEKIIHLYKEVSSFNNQYAKNNLGVIYKNGISGINKNLSLAKRISLALEYFEEAVTKKNDAVSMFNLSNLLLNEEQETKDYKKVIELLIGSSRQGLEESLQLLAFILIEKHKNICYNTIKNELNAYGQQSDDLVINLFQMCKIFLHENKESFQKMYQNIRKTDLIYIKHKIYTLNEVEKARYSHVLSQKSNLKDIDEYFYEGFEFPI